MDDARYTDRKMDNVIDNDSVKSLQGSNLLSVYEAIFNSIADAVIFTDTKRRIIHMNQAAIEQFGYALHEVRGKTSELFYADKADYVIQGGKHYTRGKPPDPKPYENIYLRKDGSSFIGETLGNHVNDNHGDLLGFMGVIRDITDRKKADELATRFGRIVEDSLNEVYLFDDTDLHFIEANRGARENLGYTMEELRKLTPIDIKPEYSASRFMDLLKPLRNNTRKKILFESLHQRKDGSTYPVEVHLQRVNFGADTVFMAIILDITERKEAKQLQEQLTSIFDATPDFIGITDPRGKFRYLNAAARRMIGIGPDEDITQCIIPDFHPKRVTAQILNTAIPIAIREGIWHGETLLKTRDKKTIPTLQVFLAHKSRNGEVDFFSTVARDITDLKNAEDELKQHRDHLEELVAKRSAVLKEQAQIIDQIHDSVISTDLEGHITSWNKGAERMLGYTTSEAMGKHISLIFPEEYYDFLQNDVITPLREHGDHEVEARMRNKAGQLFYAHLSLSMLYDESGAPKGMVGYSIDITERKHTELLLQRRTEELAAANKELEGFSYSVSHDLRSPLRAIDGFSLALAEDYQDLLDDTGKDYLNRLRNGAQRMGELIDDLLELSRVNRESLQRMQVNLSAMVQDVFKLLEERDPERNVTLHLTPNIQVYADHGLLRILIDNLLDNAWKYTSRNPHANIEFGVTEAQGEKTYFIRDDGIGFDMRYADRLFGAFQRLHHKDEFSGTGIGLATVQRIIHRHGGHIRAESEPGKGATFFFTLGS